MKQAIAAGKDVYSEWPLTTSTAESEELLSLAEAKGVRHIVGLQRRMGPSARYTRDLVKKGYVGKIRGVQMTVSADAFVPEMSIRHSWAFDSSNFSNVLSIYAAHFGDMLFRSVGFPERAHCDRRDSVSVLPCRRDWRTSSEYQSERGDGDRHA